MPGTNGHVSNGYQPQTMPVAPEVETRKYHCLGCGYYLGETDAPLGSPIVWWMACPDSRCRRLNTIRIGQRPPPHPNRGRWLEMRQALRKRAGTSF